MVGSNKILTVSYGTFSCTLEGFEDSFGTMKAIAEYFRDLAADDRYFGAEPPVPDVQMLARIAEREVDRRVEARIDASGITLRTGQALPASMAATLHSAAPVSETTLPVATAAADGDVVGPEAEVIGDDTSMLLAASDPTMEIPVVFEPTAAQTLVAPPVAAEPLMPPAATAPVAPVRPIKVLLPTTPVALPPVAISLPEVVMPPMAIPAHPDADSVAAKLQRIRAVVGRGTLPLATQEFAEDLADNLPTAPTEAGDPQTDLIAAFSAPDDANSDTTDQADAPFDMASLTAALATDDSSIIEDEIDGPVAPIAPVRARVIRMRRADFDRATAQDADIAPAVVVETAQDLHDLDRGDDLNALADLHALDGVDVAEDDAFDTMSDDSPPSFADEAEDDLLEDHALALPDAIIGSGTLSPDDEAELLQELAAVERETLAALATAAESETEVEAEVARDLVVEELAAEDLADEPDTTLDRLVAGAMETAAKAADPRDDTPLDSVDIAALFDSPSDADATFDFTAIAETADQADYAADILSGAEPETEVEPASGATPALRSGRDLLEREPEDDQEAMDRILSQTDAELNAPETSRRREAMAQLKAAVAATEAARRLGDLSHDTTTDENDVENAFRDDLKQVVRPRRPMTEVKPDLRSERPKPAPLKLVASQRIDIPAVRPATAPVMPVRPRRVSVEPEAMVVPVAAAMARRQAGSFAEFAESMGAKALPDLLEAAAAYTSFVEGVEDFSRPQLMKKVQDMADTDFSREDGLRSFGTLLRQGRIMKTRNGRFVVSEETRFNPERRAG